MTGPLQEHAIELDAAVRRQEIRELPHLDYLPIEPCLAVDAQNDEACWFDRFHQGPHSWHTRPPRF